MKNELDRHPIEVPNPGKDKQITYIDMLNICINIDLDLFYDRQFKEYDTGIYLSIKIIFAHLKCVSVTHAVGTYSYYYK